MRFVYQLLGIRCPESWEHHRCIKLQGHDDLHVWKGLDTTDQWRFDE